MCSRSTLGLIFALAALIPARAQAQTADYIRQESAIGFDSEGDRYAVRTQVTGGDALIVVREVATGARIKEFEVATRAREKKVRRILARRFQVRGDSVEGQTSPDERYTILGAPNRDGKQYRILIMEGARVGELHRIALKYDKKARKPATGILKQVVWTPDGKRLLVVLNEKYEDESQSYEVDRTIPIRFKRWKIKWYRPKKKGPG